MHIGADDVVVGAWPAAWRQRVRRFSLAAGLAVDLFSNRAILPSRISQGGAELDTLAEHVNGPAETRDFFVDLLGFEVAMDMGRVATVASPDNPSDQITVVGGDDMAAPGITVEVGDVDAIHAKAQHARPRRAKGDRPESAR
jgi:hypothetical protein